ncbi:MAG: TetR/AcrR family transcriptional regulator [Olsenella sp.]|jgi:AcrR family transcriptional regulator|nr:TetR/AcrR family transcriptional regulator [Olsenella sp.]
MARDTSTDLRVVRTRRAIESALVSLMVKTPLDEVTVKQICSAALVNKGTFYRHYRDKYDVAECIARRELDEFEKNITNCIEIVARTGSYSELDSMVDNQEVGRNVGTLILLERVTLDGQTVQDHVRAIIARALGSLAKLNMVSQDIETEAWVLTMLIFDYPKYHRTMKHPVDTEGYTRAVTEVTGIYQRLFSD